MQRRLSNASPHYMPIERTLVRHRREPKPTAIKPGIAMEKGSGIDAINKESISMRRSRFKETWSCHDWRNMADSKSPSFA